MALDLAKQGKGKLEISNLGDYRYKGWEKWHFTLESKYGVKSTVHYVRDPKTGRLMDFKFKKFSHEKKGNFGAK